VHAVGPPLWSWAQQIGSADGYEPYPGEPDCFIVKLRVRWMPMRFDSERPTPPTMTHLNKTFAELGVREEIVRALAEKGIEHPFAIQELTLPLALAGDDLIGQARTGMGKTYAFGVPLLHRVSTDETRPLNGTPRALIVVPTRELCIQVYNDLAEAAQYVTTSTDSGASRKFSVTSIYGGRPYEPQIEALRKGVDVVVGTPGRLLDLAQQGHLQLGGLSVLVLDEADEMLDLGFLPDIERILRLTPDDRQSMLFSATMPDPIITLARTFMNQPTHIRAEAPHSAATHDTTEQFAYRAHALDKSELVSRILQADGRGATMIFTRTKRTAQKVSDELAERGFKVDAVHGDLGQGAREKALKSFRTGAVDVLVATDVAARGIDIDDVTHVINYQCPEDEQAYVHRIGRTGRAGKTGTAITLVDWDELPRWETIDKALNLNCPDPAETYSSSPHIYEELGIPTDATGRIGEAVKAAKPKRSPDEKRISSADSEGRAAKTRTRSRRRTRGGDNGDGQPESTSAPVQDSAVTAPVTESEDTAGDASTAARRRRRRRPRKTETATAG
jgi:superfamily II DNA/RNA helicase